MERGGENPQQLAFVESARDGSNYPSNPYLDVWSMTNDIPRLPSWLPSVPLTSRFRKIPETAVVEDQPVNSFRHFKHLLSPNSSRTSPLKMMNYHRWTLPFALLFLFALRVAAGSTVFGSQMNFFKSFTAQQQSSIDCMHGIPTSLEKECEAKILRDIHSIPCLVEAVNCVYKTIPKAQWEKRQAKLTSILSRTKLSLCEISKYAMFDQALPYTRNLIATDHENYSLLLLCWNPGRESKIHNHPCDGCFVKVIHGAVKETRYEINPHDDSLKITAEVVATPGSSTYMDDSIGLHKIGNPSDKIGAITLHLYTPPYNTCKIWSNDAEKYSDHTNGISAFYSEYAVRSVSKDKDILACYI